MYVQIALQPPIFRPTIIVFIHSLQVTDVAAANVYLTFQHHKGQPTTGVGSFTEAKSLGNELVY